LLFERPLLLVPVLVAVQLVLIGVWSRRRTRGARRVMFAGFIAFALLVLLQALVVTDRERLVASCWALARAVQAGDVEAFADHVSENFATEGLHREATVGKEGLTEWLEQVLHTYSVEEPNLRQFQIEVTGDRALVRFTATCRIITPQEVVSRYPSAWEFDFGWSERRWQVTDIRPQPTRLFPYRRLADIPR